MKIGLYSITYPGIWYRGRALTLPEVVERAAAIGFDGIEIDGKRPHGNPIDWDERARREFRELCATRGVEADGPLPSSGSRRTTTSPALSLSTASASS
jgi:sugar phosphate isomerase/epimerase